MGDSGDGPGRARHPTMQVDVEDLYAELESRKTAPPPLPAGQSPSSAPSIPQAGLPQGIGESAPAPQSTGRIWAMAAVAILVAAGAAYALSRVVFADDPAPAEPTGTMELGPIEVE